MVRSKAKAGAYTTSKKRKIQGPDKLMGAPDPPERALDPFLEAPKLALDRLRNRPGELWTPLGPPYGPGARETPTFFASWAPIHKF